MPDSSPWPDTVPFLSYDQNVHQQYSTPWTDGYPNDLLGWVEYSFPNHSHRIAFWTLFYRLETLFYKHRTEILKLMRIESEEEHISEWNTVVRTKFNVTNYILGYTENQTDRVAAVAQFAKDSNFFQKLDVLVGCRYGIYYPIHILYENNPVSLNQVLTVNRSEFDAEEKISTEYNQRTYTGTKQPTYNRSSNNRRSKAKAAPVIKGNPARERLMRAKENQ